MSIKINPEKLASLSRGASDAELCALCIYAGVTGSRQPSFSRSSSVSPSKLLRVCAGCGRDFFPSSSQLQSHHLNDYPAQSTEDIIESGDSGNSSGHSERQNLSAAAENHIVAIKTESNIQPKQMLRMEVAVMRRLTGKANFCELLACGKNTRINYIVMTLQVGFVIRHSVVNHIALFCISYINYILRTVIFHDCLRCLGILFINKFSMNIHMGLPEISAQKRNFMGNWM